MNQSTSPWSPWDVSIHGDPEADSLLPHRAALEGGHDGGDEVLHCGEAGLAHAPRLIQQEHQVDRSRCPAGWGGRGGGGGGGGG